MPSVSSTSTVAPTSSSDLTPDDTITAGVRAAAARSADTSGGAGNPRWTPPSPPVPMKRMPTAARGHERAADRRRADRPLRGAHPEVARADLARGGSEALELVGGEADAHPPVEDADGRGHGAGRAHGGLAREPDLDPGREPGSRARRASSRARRRRRRRRAPWRPRRRRGASRAPRRGYSWLHGERRLPSGPTARSREAWSVSASARSRRSPGRRRGPAAARRSWTCVRRVPRRCGLATAPAAVEVGDVLDQKHAVHPDLQPLDPW